MSRLLPFIFLLIALTACATTEEPVTKEEALALSHVIDSSIRNKKPAYFNSLIDEASFAGKIAKGYGGKLSAEMRSGIKAALKHTDLGDKIIKAIQPNGTYEFVKQYEKDKVQHLIFRLYSDDGLNYHDYELSKKGGKLAIADIFIYLSGEELSKTLSDLFTNFSTNDGKVSDEKLAQIEKVKKMRAMVERNDIENALKYYNSLPTVAKNQRSIMLLHVMICAKSDEETYMKAINDYLALYPEAPNIHLVSIDNYIMRKDYGKAIESIDKVDKLVNTDPFLDYMRALMYKMMEKPVEARGLLEKLYRNMPDFEAGVMELIANYIDAGDDSKARKLIKEYEANKNFDQPLLDNYLSMRSFSREEK